MTWFWIVVGSVLGGLAALLGGGSGVPDPGPTAGAVEQSIVTTWSEADHDVDDVRDAVSPTTVVVIDTEVERADFLDRVPPDLPTDAVAAVDLTTHVVVAGGYDRCTESSSVVESTGADAVDGYLFVVETGDDRVDCAWSPYTVDVWAVERPDPVEPVTLVASWSQADPDSAVGDWRVGPAVLTATADVQAFAASAPTDLRPAVAGVVGPVDLDTHVVVVGGYPDCVDHSEVGEGPSFVVVDDDPGRSCDWSPYVVDVHVVPR